MSEGCGCSGQEGECPKCDCGGEEMTAEEAIDLMVTMLGDLKAEVSELKRNQNSKN